MTKVPVRLTDEQQEFISKQVANKLSSTAISRAFQRRFGTVLTPQRIEELKPRIAIKKERRADVQAIKDKLSTHDDQLEFARNLIIDRMRDEEVSNNELVNLAKELRQNVVSAQQIATMNDDAGNAQYILMYGDEIQKTSEDANVEDVDFTVLED